MNNRVVKRLAEIAKLHSTLKNIEVVEWTIKYHSTIMNDLEDRLYPLIYESNDKLFRYTVYNILNRFFNECIAVGMLGDFSIVCDDTNNPSSIIDNNDFVVDISIKPIRYIDEWIYIPISFT